MERLIPTGFAPNPIGDSKVHFVFQRAHRHCHAPDVRDEIRRACNQLCTRQRKCSCGFGEAPIVANHHPNAQIKRCNADDLEARITFVEDKTLFVEQVRLAVVIPLPRGIEQYRRIVPALAVFFRKTDDDGFRLLLCNACNRIEDRRTSLQCNCVQLRSGSEKVSTQCQLRKDYNLCLGTAYHCTNSLQVGFDVSQDGVHLNDSDLHSTWNRNCCENYGVIW